MLNLLRKNKKGFTLVELIVVLVILAILAAILIPSLTGYVDKANERAVMAEARSAFLAAQTLASEQYALGNTAFTAAAAVAISASTDFTLADIADLAETPDGTVTACTVTHGVVTGLTYTNDGHTATYDSTLTPPWTVS